MATRRRIRAAVSHHPGYPEKSNGKICQLRTATTNVMTSSAIWEECLNQGGSQMTQTRFTAAVAMNDSETQGRSSANAPVRNAGHSQPSSWWAIHSSARFRATATR